MLKKIFRIKRVNGKKFIFFCSKRIKNKVLEPSFLNDELEIETHFEKKYNFFNRIITANKKNKNVICKVNVKLVWINGISKKPSRIPKNIIARFNSRQVV